MDYMRIQETELANLRSKVNQIDEEMEDLLKQNVGEEEEEAEEEHEDEVEEEAAESKRLSSMASK